VEYRFGYKKVRSVFDGELVSATYHSVTGAVVPDYGPTHPQTEYAAPNFTDLDLSNLGFELNVINRDGSLVAVDDVLDAFVFSAS